MIVSEYIKKEEATSIPVIPKEHRKHFNNLNDAFETGWNEALACVNMIPSADVVEVRHGHWDFYGLIDDIYGHGASCSVCGEYSEDNGYYCSCCGAKMDDALQRKTNPEAFKGGDDYE